MNASTVQPDLQGTGHPSVIPTVVGVFLLLAGAGKLIGALALSAVMIQSDRDGGLFGIKLGAVVAVALGIPVGLFGAFDLLAGLGTVRRKTWGYVMGLVTGVVGALAFLIPVLGSVVGAGRSLLGPNPDGATLTSTIGVVSFFSVGFTANALIVAGLTRTRAAFGR